MGGEHEHFLHIVQRNRIKLLGERRNNGVGNRTQQPDAQRRMSEPEQPHHGRPETSCPTESGLPDRGQSNPRAGVWSLKDLRMDAGSVPHSFGALGNDR